MSTETWESGTIPLQLVVDTNVLVAGLRSNRGAAFRLLHILNDARWQLILSVALLLEYEEVLKRESTALRLSYEDVDEIVNAIAIFAICGCSRSWDSQW